MGDDTNTNKKPYEEGNKDYASYDDWKQSANPEFNSLQQVTLTFFSQERDHAEFLLSLKRDKVSINMFFQTMVKLYASGDKRVLEIVDEARSSYRNMKYNEKKEKSLSKQRDNMKRFALDESDVEDIFDIIESEGQ